MYKNKIDIHPEVVKALSEGKPVVALESTIISHGMPYPQNVETAREVENIIREKGVVPATIAILKGRIKVGLTADELEYLGKAKEVAKVSRRDIPFIVAMGKDGATTVAATMICAELAGIQIFVTGGIGGVHRNAQETFDISADLTELGQTNVAVICAGAKSILDIGLTLEYLETLGVPVVGYQTEELPAFYTRKSGFKVDYRVDDAKTVAEAMHSKWSLGLKGGVIIANPIPEAYQMDFDIITDAIETALKEADAKGIKGKASTPFLLAKVKELTGGDSLESNIQLVYNNARVGAEIALEYAKLQA
ncbi:pseudouridine-5'-phosphate glycosidase [Fusibacter ferrireducens]|uniref:Pseudouridine-5'-phosphate glycosidase n=1 Tax=Fusibacter ferrireducens TaxID=2785058 RepID=A0ABR9ZY10_9FIRM|nr:pseudouridine-5'-phosphate glycosidase [Fusibacter ferrireducens]MBF4695342.1 pseudouridine-5'-phosphate glycosidase [Fusibacter ferrireducens]